MEVETGFGDEAIDEAGSVLHLFEPGFHQYGELVEAVFGEAWMDVAGERTKCFVFAPRLAYSGKAVYRNSHRCKSGALSA
ncbi:hypothetical protein ACFRDV_39265 [Streptomyces fagopyri]|uniref:hypothetical protein n=1 Tax=Streptomyces fagopyri TaxID=2662397 RepID=UPI0036B470A2